MKVNVAGPGYEIPSGSTLSGSVLERQYEADKTELRVVVDLKWPKSKIPGIPYGNKKGCLSVCGLMPGRHGNDIAATKKQDGHP